MGKTFHEVKLIKKNAPQFLALIFLNFSKNALSNSDYSPLISSQSTNIFRKNSLHIEPVISNLDFEITVTPAKTPKKPSMVYKKINRENIEEYISKHQPITGADLRGINLSGLENYHFLGCKIDNEQFKFVIRNGIHIPWLNLTETHLNLDNINLNQVSFDQTQLTCDQAIYLMENGANLEGSYISGGHFKNTALEGAQFPRVHFFNVTFEGSNLTKVNFKGADFLSCDFKESTLVKANFTEAHMSASSLIGADFTRANFNKSSFIRINLSKANFTGADLTDAIFELSDFTRANFNGTTLTRSNLIATNLTRAELKGAKFKKTKLERANFSDLGVGTILKIMAFRLIGGVYY